MNGAQNESLSGPIDSASVPFVRAVALALFCACGVTDPQVLRSSATVRGAVSVPDGLSGDAWLFLYAPGRGLPNEPAVPEAVTAVSANRLSSGYVFGEVAANPYRLFGILDIGQDFRADIDVLAQPTRGDRVGQGVEFNLQPGRPLELDCQVSARVERDPPAFRVENVDGPVVALDATQAGPTVLNVVADSVGQFSSAGFPIGLVDEDGDGTPDDRDGDRVPDLSLLFFLRWLPAPGQNPSGEDIVVPLVPNPAPLLSSLGGDVRARLMVDRLTLVVVPQAQVLEVRGSRRTLRAFGAPGTGEYELVVLSGDGQFWRLPNQLGPTIESQAVRFRFERARP